jgi:hypothetical protein
MKSIHFHCILTVIHILYLNNLHFKCLPKTNYNIIHILETIPIIMETIMHKEDIDKDKDLITITLNLLIILLTIMLMVTNIKKF